MGGTAEAGPSNRDSGQRVANPTRAYTAAGRSLSSIRGNAPSTTDRNTNTLVDLCLSYYLRGGCYSNCQWSSTHRPLTALDGHIRGSVFAPCLKHFHYLIHLHPPMPHPQVLPPRQHLRPQWEPAIGSDKSAEWAQPPLIGQPFPPY